MIEKIIEKKLIPVTVIEDAQKAAGLADALLQADLKVIEVTLRTQAAIDSIARIKKSAPEMLVGAGTVLDHKLIPRLVDSGVSFAITPGLNPLVIESAQKHGLLIMPGVITPSEIEQARNYELQTLKFFPAEAAGGAAMLKALAGPYGHTGLRFIPTGGINSSNLPDYLALDSVAAVGGSWFVSARLVNEGNFEEITRLTREALSLIP